MTDAEHAAVLRRLLEYYPNAEWVAAIERAIELLEDDFHKLPVDPEQWARQRELLERGGWDV